MPVHIGTEECQSTVFNHAKPLKSHLFSTAKYAFDISDIALLVDPWGVPSSSLLMPGTRLSNRIRDADATVPRETEWKVTQSRAAYLDTVCRRRSLMRREIA